MVIDSATILTAFFNFTKAAEAQNVQNLLVSKLLRLVAAFQQVPVSVSSCGDWGYCSKCPDN